MAQRGIVIIGAGVVGAALADELVLRGEHDVTVIDKGPLFATGGSSSHAPGLISRTSTSRFMTETADATVRKYATLSTGEGPALLPVGTLEVAYTEERLAELWRRWGAARAFGWPGRMIGPDDAVELWPTIERDGLLGAYATDGEGLAAALRAVEAQAGRAAEGGARFVGETAISEIITDRGAVRGVRTTTGDTIDADVVVCCAGVWGPALAESVGLTTPDAADRAPVRDHLTDRRARRRRRARGDAADHPAPRHRHLLPRPRRSRRGRLVPPSGVARAVGGPRRARAQRAPEPRVRLHPGGLRRGVGAHVRVHAGTPRHAVRAPVQRCVRVHAGRVPADRRAPRPARVLGRGVGVGHALRRRRADRRRPADATATPRSM